jgi:hypothetical protein
MRARKYRLTTKGMKMPVNNQSGLIKQILEQDGEVTTQYIAEQIKPVLKTRQTPERVVAFYISTWKKQGFVEAILDDVVEASKTPVSTGDVSKPEETPAIADVPSEDYSAEEAEGRRLRYLDIDKDAESVQMNEMILYVLAKLNEPASVQDVTDIIEEEFAQTIEASTVGDLLRALLSEGLVLRSQIGEYSLV